MRTAALREPYCSLLVCQVLIHSLIRFSQALSPTGVDIRELPTNREVMSKWPQRYTGKVPSNHFTLNDDQDCLEAMRWLEENAVSSEGEGFPYTRTLTGMFSRLIVSLIPWCNWCLINSNKAFHPLRFVFQINLQFVVIFDTQHI